MERILGNLADDDETATKDEEEEESPSKKKKKDRMSQTKDDNLRVTPTATVTNAEAAGASTENLSISNSEPVEPSSITSGMRTRYIGDMSPLPFLAQKINFEDARIASKIGVKIKRFGQSLILYEKDENLNGKSANQLILEDLNLIKPGETIKGINDWIFKVSGVDKTTSDSLMKV